MEPGGGLKAYLQASLLLRVVVQRVGECGEVVADAAAHRYGDLLAARLHAGGAAHQRAQQQPAPPHLADTLRNYHLRTTRAANQIHVGMHVVRQTDIVK